MKGSRISLLLLLSVIGLATPRASGIVLFGGDIPEYLEPPTNGAPWRYVAKVGDPSGSGVYLGKRFILTAHHVGLPDPIVLDGKTYSIDYSFEPKRIKNEDLRIFRINGDPGLPDLPLIGRTQSDFARRCVVIGWGLGRGEEISGQGWLWSTPRIQRWGTNVTGPRVVRRQGDGPRLFTAFHHKQGPGEMSLANADSGCGLFINYRGVWKLAAIGVDVDENAAYYDRNPARRGAQPCRSFYVRLRPHLAAIKAILNSVP